MTVSSSSEPFKDQQAEDVILHKATLPKTFGNEAVPLELVAALFAMDESIPEAAPYKRHAPKNVRKELGTLTKKLHEAKALSSSSPELVSLSRKLLILENDAQRRIHALQTEEAAINAGLNHAWKAFDLVLLISI